ncbi:MAG: phosphoadenylyl-sulfate reductase [Lentimicrobiaceae bacterium]|jgi:phosphoadenosine phosphosulfate reductase|nr:phosphoadenylyl-sulfate reductase [Lentimicrobiaceae bacterium]
MTQEQINELNNKLQGVNTIEILKIVSELFYNKITFASSLSYEDQVITHLIAEEKLPIQIFTLDTGRLFPETYELIDRTYARYQIPIQIYFPEVESVEQMVNTEGINLFYDSIDKRKLCCKIRKIKPLARALKNSKAWITGLRHEQAVTRYNMQIVEWDTMHQLIKVNPLINWTEKEIVDFVKKHNIPYNKLHDKNFPSIGCQPCTRAVTKGEDIRSGRWWWENPDQKECGLHKS